MANKNAKKVVVEQMADSKKVAKALAKGKAVTTAPKASTTTRRYLAITRGDEGKTLRVRVLAESNPKREGSASAKRFAAYRDGMTVAEALAAGVTSADVRWDVQHGLIALE